MNSYLKLVCPSEDKLNSLKSHELRNSRLYVVFSHITFIPLMLFTISNYMTGKYLAGHIDFIGFLSFVLLLIYFKFTGHYRRSVIGFVLTCQLVISFQHLIAPVGLGTNLLWAPLIIMTSSYLLGRSWGIKLGILNAIIMIAAEVIPRYFQTPLESFNSTEILQYNLCIIIVTTLSAFLVTNRILVEEREYLTNLEKQKKDLFEEKEAKAALLNIIAHDIANPLTLIQARLHHLQMQIDGTKEFDQVKAKSHVAQLVKRANEINKSIELIRNFRAYESGKLEIKLTAVNLNEVLDSSIEVFFEQISLKKVSILKSYSEKTDYKILADPTSLQMSVLNNLISNAIKFSHPSSNIEISLNNLGEYVELKIRDYGIGIPDEIKPFLFSGARPTSRNGTGGEQGTGFGMPILKMFLDKYGAKITLSEPAEGGTLFTILFRSAISQEEPKIVAAKN